MSTPATRPSRTLFAAFALAAILLGGGLLVSPAHADEVSAEYVVYVGGQKMEASSDGAASYYVNGTNGTSGTVYSVEPPDGYNAKLYYDSGKGLTLELNGLNASGISGSSNVGKGGSVSSLDVEAHSGIHSAYPLELVLKGENAVAGEKTSGMYNPSPETDDSRQYVAYGIYAGSELVVSAESTGSLEVTTPDVDGNCYGIYGRGGISFLGGSVTAMAGCSTGEAGSLQNSIGVFALGKIIVGGAGLSPSVKAIAGDSDEFSVGFYSDSGMDIGSGVVEARSGTARNGYSEGISLGEWIKEKDAESRLLCIAGGNVTAIAGDACLDDSYGVFAGKVVVTGGSVRAEAGRAIADEDVGGGRSCGVDAIGDISIGGGTVAAFGGQADDDFSVGVESESGNIALTGAAKVIASGGVGESSIGLYCSKLSASDKTELLASGAGDEGIQRCSYGVFVTSGFLSSGEAYVKATAGKVGNAALSKDGYEKRSIGICFGESVARSPADEFGEVADCWLFQITGGTVIAGAPGDLGGSSFVIDGYGHEWGYRCCAVAFSQASFIAFCSDDQKSDEWYQWKVSSDDDFVRSSSAAYPYASSQTSPTTYFHVEPLALEPDAGFDSTPNPDPGSGSDPNPAPEPDSDLLPGTGSGSDCGSVQKPAALPGDGSNGGVTTGASTLADTGDCFALSTLFVVLAFALALLAVSKRRSYRKIKQYIKR